MCKSKYKLTDCIYKPQNIPEVDPIRDELNIDCMDSSVCTYRQTNVPV